MAKWISLKRLRMHEVHTTIRLMQRERVTWPQRSEVFTDLQERSIKSFLRFAGPLLLGYLMATSLRSGNDIAVKISDFEASVPAAYFFLVLSFIFLLFAVAFNQLSLSLELKSSLARKMLLPGFSINAFEVLSKRDDMAMGLPIVEYGFFREVLPITGIVGFLLMLCIWLMLLPFLAIGYFLFSELLVLVFYASTPSVERLAAAFGLLEIASAVLAVIVFHVPMPFGKNTPHVRWGFLYRLEPHVSDREKFDRWLEQEEKS